MKNNSQSVIRTFGNESQQQKDARMQWWRQARFGMFIHWGLYAVPAGQWNGETVKGVMDGKIVEHSEWIMWLAQIPIADYEPLCEQFNPVKFDADQWVKMAKDGGMKYIVITSKHHDGFALWDSEVSDYDVIDRTPFKRDILKELSEACKKQGVTFCLYHSILDWHHPDYLPRLKWDDRLVEGADFQRYIAYMKAQLKELIIRYDPAVLWFDGEWDETWTHEEGVKLHNYLCSLKPDIIINNRVDKGRKGMEGMNKEGDFAGDFGTPEQEIPAQGLPGVDWESCMTMNDNWGYSETDKNFKSPQDLIRKLVDIASKGGNFLLNIGPKADGTFPAESVERLAAIGDWMDVNGESIYGTTHTPFAELPWGRCTKKTCGDMTTLYLHVFDWPKDGKLVVKGLKNDVQKAYFLANKQLLQTSACDDGLTIEVPKEPLDAVDTVIVLNVSGKL